MNTLKTTLSDTEIKEGLAALSPEIPWAHYYNLNGNETVNQDIDPKYYNKSISRTKTGEASITIAESNVNGKTISGIRVLDLASAEGVHSIEFAQKGAREVIGIEGRQLYVDRANFIAKCLGYNNVKFIKNDIRKLEPHDIGSFDFINCCGILHHLGKEDFVPFIKLLSQLCSDTLFIDAHVSNDETIKQFRLSPTADINKHIGGSLFREHSDDASNSDKEKKVRASLDNTFSFWPTEEALVFALKQAGFKLVYRALHPHVYSSFNNIINRPFIIAKK